MYSIYVDPFGLGHRFRARAYAYEEVEHRLRQLQVRQAELWVLQHNPRARRFYEAGGWRSADVRLIEVFGSDIPEIRYCKRL